jgi:hypothetical protein
MLGQLPGSELQVAYFGTVEDATAWLTGSLVIVDGERGID